MNIDQFSKWMNKMYRRLRIPLGLSVPKVGEDLLADIPQYWAHYRSLSWGHEAHWLSCMFWCLTQHRLRDASQCFYTAYREKEGETPEERGSREALFRATRTLSIEDYEVLYQLAKEEGGVGEMPHPITKEEVCTWHTYHEEHSLECLHKGD